MKTKGNGKIIENRIGDSHIDISFHRINRLDVLIINDFKKRFFKYAKIPGIILNVDLSKINFIDSSGFSTLISILQISKKYGSKLTISNMNEDVEELINVIKLNQLFNEVSELSHLKKTV